MEIYRPLIADPKELRRQRAEKSAKIADNKKVLIEHLFDLLILLVVGQSRFVINVRQNAAAVKGQRQCLLGYAFMTGC